MKKIKVDIISDTVCPWCYVGIKNLEKAIDSMKAEYEFDVEWHPFQLNPGLPDEGMDFKLYLDKVLGNRSNEGKKAVEEKGKKAGIQFEFDKIKLISNTLRSHYLIALAKVEEKQSETAKAIFSAYFENGVEINSIENLKEIGKSCGLSESLLTNLDSIGEEDLLPLLKQEEGFRELGISSVPSFVFESQYLVQGAQDSEVFIDVVEKIHKPQVESGCGCGPEGCC
jgi:predicted DsbA family dithiol-disulfide isomerase